MKKLIVLALFSVAFPHGVQSAGGGLVTDDEQSLSGIARTRPYSPYAQRNFPDRPLWGDTHLHTAISFDAGAFGARLLPPDAYKFAKGEEIVASTGQPVRMSRPLDFLVVADHSDNMGLFPELQAGTPFIMASEHGRRWNKMINAGGQQAVTAAVELISLFSQDKFPEELKSLPGTGIYKNTWDALIEAAENANDPGRFTAFIGYEWTSLVKGNNLHRVVVYRDDADRAKLVQPFTMSAPLGSPNPLDLSVLKTDDMLEGEYARSGNRSLNPGNGKLPSVGNTVDVTNATWTNTIGTIELITVWQDPDFDPQQRAFYYARVIEIPTPRWIAYDAKYFGLDMPDNILMTTTDKGLHVTNLV